MVFRKKVNLGSNYSSTIYFYETLNKIILSFSLLRGKQYYMMKDEINLRAKASSTIFISVLNSSRADVTELLLRLPSCAVTQS